MRQVIIDTPPGLASARQWRAQARSLVAAGIAPSEISWSTSARPSFEWDEPASAASVAHGNSEPRAVLQLPIATVDLFQRVACHCARDRFALLYAALWRIAQGERHLFDLAHDKLVLTLNTMDAAVRRELHKTKAFVRFEPRPIDGGGTHYVAWFEPDHDGLELVLPFFTKRFTNMAWSILTPRLCVRWDGETLHRTTGLAKPARSGDDPLSEAWPTYYASIFNPARLKIRAMVREMPKRYWANLPEAKLIPHLSAEARSRTARMLDAPSERSMRSVPNAATALTPPSLQHCARCPHAAFATQAIPGRGPPDARIMVVGEQPGDEEDLAGESFVGPAGKMLDRVLVAAGLVRDDCYLTNAVKHFKWTLRGKRRVHKTPGQLEILACRDHLLDELATVQPRVIVALGATAASALTHDTGQVLVTYHPAYLLRAGASESREAFAAMVTTFEHARALAQGGAFDL